MLPVSLYPTLTFVNGPFIKFCSPYLSVPTISCWISETADAYIWICIHWIHTASFSRAVRGRTCVHVSIYLCTHVHVLCICEHAYMCTCYLVSIGPHNMYVHERTHTRVHFLLNFCCPSLGVYFSCVHCSWVTPIVSGYECVLAEAQQGGSLIVSGAVSSYSLPGSEDPELPLPDSPWGLLKSLALPERPAPGSSACFVQQTPLGGPHCLHHRPLGCPPF